MPSVHQYNQTVYSRYLKRFIDFSIALIALTCLSPLLILLTVINAIACMGNPFFLQKRIGRQCLSFYIIKFRTMNNKKGPDGVLLPDEERTTFFGSLLRSTSLDELPELVNVLIGDMSFIGPRPWISIQMHHFNRSTRNKRMTIRPGITGLAQVHGRNNLTFRQRVCYDLRYRRYMSFSYDLKILLYTFYKVFKREGIKQLPGALGESATRLKPKDPQTRGLRGNNPQTHRRKKPVTPTAQASAPPVTPTIQAPAPPVVQAPTNH